MPLTSQRAHALHKQRTLRGRGFANPCAWLLAVAGLVLLIAPALNFVPSPNHGQSDSNLGRRDAVARSLGVAAMSAVVGASSGGEVAWAANTRWSGTYKDPKHPGCERKITKEGNVFGIYGTSSVNKDEKGCEDNKDLKKVKRWYLEGKLPDFTVGLGEELIVDFSPKGGPSEVVAKWVGDGILFPDGNKWTKDASKRQSANMNMGG